MLEPVRASYRDDKPLVWNRVHDVPDFAYFYHNIHVQRGVACATCHGEVAEMPLTWKTATLYMEWCLECHRNPEKYVGPPEAVFASAAMAGTDDQHVERAGDGRTTTRHAVNQLLDLPLLSLP